MEEADPERNPQQQIIDRMREINEVYRDLAYYDLIIKQVVEQTSRRRRASSGVPPDRVADGMTRLGELRSCMRAAAVVS